MSTNNEAALVPLEEIQQYRLRIGDLRVFYDVTPGQVEVVAVVPKTEAAEWLARWGSRFEEEGESP